MHKPLHQMLDLNTLSPQMHKVTTFFKREEDVLKSSTRYKGVHTASTVLPLLPADPQLSAAYCHTDDLH